MDPNNTNNDVAIDAMLARINGLATGDVPVDAPPVVPTAPPVPAAAPVANAVQPLPIEQPAAVIPAVGQPQQAAPQAAAAIDDQPRAPEGHSLQAQPAPQNHEPTEQERSMADGNTFLPREPQSFADARPSLSAV